MEPDAVESDVVIPKEEDDVIDGSRWMWQDESGGFLFEEDARVAGDKWRIHKNDLDPFPSNPHAHCVAGKHQGQKIELRKGRLYVGTRATGKRLMDKDFQILLDYARKKFPLMVFPLS